MKNMQKIRNSQLLVFSLVLAISFCCSSIAIAKVSPSADGTEHRNTVATFVQSLLVIADREQEGIGEQVRVIARAQNETKDEVADGIDKINNRNKIKTFLIGTDYKNIGQLRSEMVKTGNQIKQLKGLLERAASEEIKTALQVQIGALEQEQQKINDFLKANESKFSLFGWFVKLFNK